MKSILIFVRNEEALENYVRMLKKGEYDDKLPYSMEIRKMIEEFSNNDWEVYLGTMFNFDIDKNNFKMIYDIKNKKIVDMNIEEINKKISTMIIRNVGSVEKNFAMIERCLKYLIENYKGNVLNNPKAMLRGMTKRYLVELESDKLKEYGISTIPSKIFNNNVKFEEICKEYPKNREEFLIKPVTGELSNSLKCLKDIDEEFLRHKQDKVGGWVIQPIQEEIWNGEFQMSFLDGKLIYSQKKEYPKEGSEVPNQKSRIIKKYYPSDEEIEKIQKLINYFSAFYNIKIDICRIDFMKERDGTIKLLEFEMVNPGFFIGYMNENDDDIVKITKGIRLYCEKIL